MREFLLIGAGAVLGANIRYWLTSLFTARFGDVIPLWYTCYQYHGQFPPWFRACADL